VKHKVGILFVFLVIIAFGWNAEACETCVPAPNPGQQMCSSGWQTGFQSCWGGFGVTCTPAGGSCYDPNGRKREPERDYYSVGEPCPACIEAAPDQGFVLRTDDDRLAQRATSD
jgi:hypothetical protein